MWRTSSLSDDATSVIGWRRFFFLLLFLYGLFLRVCSQLHEEGKSAIPFIDFKFAALAADFKYRGSQRDVVYLCWPIKPSYMSPNAGERGGGFDVSDWVQFWRSNFIFKLQYERLQARCILQQHANLLPYVVNFKSAALAAGTCKLAVFTLVCQSTAFAADFKYKTCCSHFSKRSQSWPTSSLVLLQIQILEVRS